MLGRVLEAIGDQVMHALPAHVGERHRWAGRVLGIGGHGGNLARLRASSNFCRPRQHALVRNAAAMLALGLPEAREHAAGR